MEQSRLGELRLWAEQLAREQDAAVAAAARTLRALVHAVDAGEVVEADRLERIYRRARVASAEGHDPTLRAAARAVLLLVEEAQSRRVAAPPATRALPRSRRLLVSLGAMLALGLLVGGVAAARRIAAPALRIHGPGDGSMLGIATWKNAAVTVAGSPGRWRLDGRDLGVRGRTLQLASLRVADGVHTLEVESRRGFLGVRRVKRIRFTLDRIPPAIRFERPPAARQWTAAALRGTTEHGARLTADGVPVAVSGGRFTLRYTPPVPRRLSLVAVDRAGNRMAKRISIALEPRRPPVPVRGVHVTFYAWADKDLRAGVMRLIAEHRINAVELDLKDESGFVGFGGRVPLAHRFGAARRIYDLPAAVKLLHSKGIRVIGRIVCFRDPVFAAAAWKAGHREWVIQTTSHTPYAGYGGFTNFANAAVRRYQIDVAIAAARAGVDDILYDYVRRPDGPLSSMRFPGLQGSPEGAIVRFLEESRRALKPYGTYVGASVFGVAATRPTEVAQPIRRMAESVDYVAPMVYPSHWGRGEYNVPNPNSQPFEIVQRSLADFNRDVRDSGARVVPWLQDFTLGVTYGPAQVRAQIDAARRDGIGEFILWDPAVTYTADALATDAEQRMAGLAKARATASPHAAAHGATAIKPPKKTTPVRRAGGRLPNELGQIPVLMHHEIRPDRVGPYDQTPAEFQAELERLWRSDYWPVTAGDLVEGNLGRVPAGKTPVVLTFDDSTRYQLFFKNGKLVRNTAVAIMLDFARTHPAFHPTGTFYVLREPFGGVPEAKAWLRWLVDHDFELGNHTKDHLPLRTLSDIDVQRELALGARVISDAVPGYRIRTMALPLGSMPHDAKLARRGQWHGIAYSDDGVFVIGANPAPSRFSRSWDSGAIPRIRSSHVGWKGEPDFAAAYWLHELDVHPDTRYVSDGDPAHITFPRPRAGDLAPRFRPRARPY